MSEAFHGAKYCWMNGEIIKTEDALISAMEPVHLSIFEGIKAYVENDVNGEGRLNIFQWKSHIDRLSRSAAFCGLKIPYTKEELLEAARKTIKANGFRTNVYVQPRIWPKAGSLEEVHVVVPVWTFDTILGRGNPKFSKERRFMISSWRRIASDALPPQAKAWANYANSALAVREATRLHYDGAIFLDNRGFVSEGTGACIMTVRDGKVVTPPVTASILESVTRGALLKILPEDLGIPVEVRDITRVELYASEEAFLCGTGWEITPITSVDDLPLGREYPGAFTKRIAEYYADIVANKVEKRKEWLASM
ncbi:MAG: branched-chain-amino-acid transaminase [Candidatus Bathyarchaeota archaeon]|nr:branched-chain-amino-acid transaminase [Candidatus Bathyarchaeota archaeon]MDH5787165.1 branched-chain-amino-acid transaminase [Candidatus Bathyarchaeota archaeon]